MRAIRTYRFKYGVVHYDRAEALTLGDAAIEAEFYTNGPLLDVWDDEMCADEFAALENAHEQ